MQNLLDKNYRWLPCTLDDGSYIKLSVNEALKIKTKNLRCARPEFDIAALLFLIGISKTKLDCTNVFGDKNRFLQFSDATKNVTLLNGNAPFPISNLLITRFNRFFGNYPIKKLCVSCSILALYSNCLFDPPTGRGYFGGSAYCQALYFIERETVEDTINANITKNNINENAYFSSPNLYWLVEPKITDNCDICDCFEPVVTHVYRGRRKNRLKIPTNPHAAITRKKNKYYIGAAGTIGDILEGVNPNSAHVFVPEIIEKNAKIWDKIICFSTSYPRGCHPLELITYEKFIIPENFIDRRIERKLVRSIYETVYPKLQVNYQSTLVIEVLKNYYNLIYYGKNPKSAAMEIFLQYSPEPIYTNKQKYLTWQYWKNLFLK